MNFICLCKTDLGTSFRSSPALHTMVSSPFMPSSKMLKVAAHNGLRNVARFLRNRLSHASDLHAAVDSTKRRFINDPRFKHELVVAGFADRRTKGGDDSAILSRILSAYDLAKRDEANAPATFKVSNEWIPIYENDMRDVMTALTRKDAPALQNIYENFFREQCSTGIAGQPVNMRKEYFGETITPFHKDLYLCDTLHRIELWRKLTGNRYPLSALSSTDIGNPYGITVDGVYVRTCAEHHHYYAQEVSRLVPSAATVVELGGGFGGMAYYLLRDNHAISYVDLDLPEGVALTSYYLMKSFPERKFVLYGEAEIHPELFSSSAGLTVLLPAHAIGNIPPQSADLVFNSYSLAEMSPDAIREYVKQLTKISRTYFLHLNHNRHSVLPADKFGIEEFGYTLLYRKFTEWNTGRSMRSDEFEYLYKR
jgi:putative sugar O-methyltransferase